MLSYSQEQFFEEIFGRRNLYNPKLLQYPGLQVELTFLI